MKGQEIRSNVTGLAFPTWEAFLAAGGKADLSNVYRPTDTNPVKFETKQISGRYVHIGYNAQGQVVSQEDLGDAGNPGTGSARTSSARSTSSPVQPRGSEASNINPSGPKTLTTTEVTSYIKGLIAKAGNVTDDNRYVLWDQVAKAIAAAGFDASNYNDILWTYFHPEGKAGYDKYVLGKQSSSSGSGIKNPFISR